MAEAKYAPRVIEPVDSAPAVLNLLTTTSAVRIIGTEINAASQRHSMPPNTTHDPIVPASRNPTISGDVVLPTCAPVKCAAIAKPRRLGYRAASVPNAGACHIDVPKPTMTTPTSRTQ